MISPIEEIIEDARNGRMFILVDHETRENEGDLVIPAQMITPEAVNFMATHGRGLICLALTGEQCDKLGLPLLVTQNASRHETAFTISIEAREGVTTGISAHDRARTISVAINPATTAADIGSPGHVFPLRAREGGVLVRAGHTEASVDIPRMAGLTPAGVICEIMNDDGTMARLPELVVFARKHGLKIGTISDLIAYRRRHDTLVRETLRKTINSRFGGEWDMRVFVDSTYGTELAEHLALVKGDISGPGPVLVRMHVLDPLTDLLGVGEPGNLQSAMNLIAKEGRGAVVFLRDTTRKLVTEETEEPLTLRKYGIGAQILTAIGLTKIELVTNHPAPKVIGLDAYGISILGTRAVPQSG